MRAMWRLASVALPLLLWTGVGSAQEVHDVLVESMRARDGVGFERLQQDELQAACSNAQNRVADESLERTLREAAMASVRYPDNGNFLGDWRRGAEIASEGRGLQYGDDPGLPNGGNCYACHQLDPQEVAYGTLGPSLTSYGGIRGRSEAVLVYTWSKIWNPHTALVCSQMPRFGAAGILTEDQIRDVMAYLFDPASPVNRQVDTDSDGKP